MVKQKCQQILLSQKCVVLFALILFSSVSNEASATGMVKLESNGFLRRSVDRSDSSSTLSLGPRLGSQGDYLETKLDFDAIVQITDTKNLSVDRSALAFESQNAYLATSRSVFSKHQFTLGRRIYDWAKFDQEWQFGAISPRFIWDPTRPQIVGLTGVFHAYENEHWRWMNYASPLSIPERGYPLRNENGKLLSSNPFYNPYFDSAVIAKKNIPVQYTVVMPPIGDLIKKSGAMTTVRYSTSPSGQGYWIQGMYGFLPILQPNLAVEPTYPPPYSAIDVRVHPAIQRHHLLMLETGVQEKQFSLWASVTKEKPTSRPVPSLWIATRSEPATVLSAGGDVSLFDGWKLKGSYIYVSEKRTVVENVSFTVDLPGRFPYHRAARGSLEYQANERMNYAFNLITDIEYKSQLMSLDVTYVIATDDHAITLNVGSDFFASATGKGYIGQYKGNDRFRGGVAYAF
ncbi:MAG: hypothetical protein H7301_05835 [Cryobacterium sp.]|nr:hypothetical protein [Oligoflexia bacterium]